MTDPSTQQLSPMSGSEPATAGIPDDALCIVPLRNMVLFPGVMQSVTIGRADSVAAIEVAVRAGRRIGLLLQKDPAQEHPSGTDLYDVGTAASVLRFVTMPDGGRHLVCSGESRFRATEFLAGFP